MPSAGTASSDHDAPESEQRDDRVGARPAPARGRLIPPRPIRRLSRHSSGTRGRSTQRPSLTSSAGSTVIEPSTATATTRIAPVASELNVASPITYSPAIEAITAPPETRIEWPDVCRRDLDGVEGASGRRPAPRARA